MNISKDKSTDFEKLMRLINSKKGYEGVNEKKKMLAIVRMACMARNKIFQADCEKLRKLKKSGSPKLRSKEREFCHKWGIDRQGIPIITHKTIQVIDADRQGFITLKVSLFPAVTPATNMFREIYKKWRKSYEEEIAEEDFEFLLQDGLLPESGISRDEHLKKVKADMNKRRTDAQDRHQIQDYDTYIRNFLIWDSWESAGKLWEDVEQIIKTAGFDTISQDGIRNAYDAINKMIQEGVPGFKMFPKK